MLNIIENFYLNTNGHVTVGDFISDNFHINLGVKQGDPLNPFRTPTINGITIPCLFWAADLVLIDYRISLMLSMTIALTRSYPKCRKNKENSIFNKTGATLKNIRFTMVENL